MCFLIHRHFKKPIIPPRDVTCYKIVIPTTEENKFLSAEQRFPYELGWEYEEEEFGSVLAAGVIEVGIHSYSTLHKAVLEAKSNGGCFIIDCCIPAGTEYYYNSDMRMFVSRSIRLERIRQREYCKAPPVTFDPVLFASVVTG